MGEFECPLNTWSRFSMLKEEAMDAIIEDVIIIDVTSQYKWAYEDEMEC
ncbi:hypothetical protein Hdeb2414_s0001g00040391 [Helianthus debilis subsp. tardiflorus]